MSVVPSVRRKKERKKERDGKRNQDRERSVVGRTFWFVIFAEMANFWDSNRQSSWLASYREPTRNKIEHVNTKCHIISSQLIFILLPGIIGLLY